MFRFSWDVKIPGLFKLGLFLDPEDVEMESSRKDKKTKKKEIKELLGEVSGTNEDKTSEVDDPETEPKESGKREKPKRVAPNWFLALQVSNQDILRKLSLVQASLSPCKVEMMF